MVYRINYTLTYQGRSAGNLTVFRSGDSPLDLINAMLEAYSHSLYSVGKINSIAPDLGTIRSPYNGPWPLTTGKLIK